MAIARVYKYPTKFPMLFDKVIQELQDVLSTAYWIDHIFGKSERLVKMSGEKRIYTPNVYKGNDEYISLLPDNEELGTYCFFVLDDPQEVINTQDLRAYNNAKMRAQYSLIVWISLKSVSMKPPTMNRVERNIEWFKNDLLGLIGKATLKNGSVTIERFYERAENVFAGYSLDEVDNQYLMEPYIGLRITGELITKKGCFSALL